MTRPRFVLLFLSASVAIGTAVALTSAAHPPEARPLADVPLEIAKIHWEYNATANDLGVHVSLDGEDWKQLKIIAPDAKVIFQVQGGGPYKELGMTELFFEGAEPSLDEFPLQDLLDLFPEGEYEFRGATADGGVIEGEHPFSHAIPDGPRVFVDVGANDFLRIRWNAVTSPPPGFPNRPIHIVGYQVIVEPKFDVTLPATARSCTVAPEFVRSLGPGVHPFEVLAIEASGNQTLTEGSFVL